MGANHKNVKIQAGWGGQNSSKQIPGGLTWKSELFIQNVISYKLNRSFPGSVDKERITIGSVFTGVFGLRIVMFLFLKRVRTMLGATLFVLCCGWVFDQKAEKFNNLSNKKANGLNRGWQTFTNEKCVYVVQILDVVLCIACIPCVRVIPCIEYAIPFRWWWRWRT